ncbi:MAG: transferrin-binding protein-like solute binding protein [Deltaproteobacteria bacterium]|nr:transferrin-binding protein-like solute binding protein [Deltaproteobacteria bacterium]
MKTGLTIAVLAVAVALAACTRTLDPPTPEEQARETNAAIVGAADTLLMGDRLGYFATDDEVERTNTTCRGDTCAAGFISLSGAGGFGVEGSELTLLRERRGVSLVRQERSGADRGYEAWGGWLEHSLFGTRLTRFTEEAGPSRGASVVSSYSLGFSTGENPSAEGSARWEGLMLGRDLRASAGRGQVIRGDADVTVEFGAAAITADVAFTDIVNIETGAAQNDMAWRGTALEDGGFARRNAPGDTVSGRFYGPDEEEVGGVFERDGIAGAFGGRRTSAP